MTNSVILYIWLSIVYNSFKYVLQTDQTGLLKLKEQICSTFQNILFSPNRIDQYTEMYSFSFSTKDTANYSKRQLSV